MVGGKEVELIRTAIKDMHPYSPPLEGRTKRGILLSDFNERMIPPHSLVQRVVKKYAEGGNYQVYPEYRNLNNILAEYAGVDPKQIIATNGSDQAIDITFRLFVEKGDKVIMPTPTFAMLGQSGEIQGSKFILPRYEGENLDFPYEEVLNAIKPGVKLVVVCNPNNPTGTFVPKDRLETIIKKANKVRAGVLVDEAYFESARQIVPDISAVDLIPSYDNLVVTRSLSKGMGTAALRTGYALAQEQIIAELNKIRGPYDVNMFAGLAMRALRYPQVRRDMEDYSREVMTMSKPQLEEFYRQLGISYVPSVAPFHLLREVPGLYDYLRKRGIGQPILTRPRSDPPETVRVTIGPLKYTEIYMNAIRGYRESQLKK